MSSQHESQMGTILALPLAKALAPEKELLIATEKETKNVPHVS